MKFETAFTIGLVIAFVAISFCWGMTTVRLEIAQDQILSMIITCGGGNGKSI